MYFVSSIDLGYPFSDQTNQWNAGAPQTRTISQSSAGDNASSDGGWNAGVSAPIAGVTRASPPNPINSQPTMSNEPNNWGAQNGSVDPRKLNRWESNPGPGPGTGPGPSHPMRMNSMNDSGKFIIQGHVVPVKEQHVIFAAGYCMVSQ